MYEKVKWDREVPGKPRGKLYYKGESFVVMEFDKLKTGNVTCFYYIGMYLVDNLIYRVEGKWYGRGADMDGGDFELENFSDNPKELPKHLNKFLVLKAMSKKIEWD